MTKMVHARDTISGKVGMVPKVYLDLPGFKEHLVEVEEGAKDYEPSMYTPSDVREFEQKRHTQRKIEKSKPETQPLALPEHVEGQQSEDLGRRNPVD